VYEMPNWLLEEMQEGSAPTDDSFVNKIREILFAENHSSRENLDWLQAHMPPYFFITMKEETQAIASLATTLRNVPTQRKITLLDQDKKLIVARVDEPGSLYETMRTLKEREISYAEITHSYGPIPGFTNNLEVQRFEFDLKGSDAIMDTAVKRIPDGTSRAVLSAMKHFHPDFDLREFNKVLHFLWLNNESYVRISPPERIARVLWLYQQGRRNDDLFLDVKEMEDPLKRKEARLLLSVGNPPKKGFLTQIMEVFQRLDIGVRRSYCLNINSGVHTYFLGTFYLMPRDGKLLEKESECFRKLKAELYNTQILAADSPVYTSLLMKETITGEEASLANAFIAFCHTSLAHHKPDRFDLDVVRDAFCSHPDMLLTLMNLFKVRFDPEAEDRESVWETALEQAAKAIEGYNTGHKHLDEVRRVIYRTCLLFIRHTLKTNFFVPEKQSLAFRLDPAYLLELGPEFTQDLPEGRPYRVTFFFSRHGAGYHIGFSDIARGGWRTIICRTTDEFTTNVSNLFREVFVLAHTQHLKNKDIYEGGSKLTVALDATDLESPQEVTQRLYKLQYSILNAFFDIFVTVNGKAKNTRVVDYYGQDEPIELGPDENMHDNMIELIAQQSVRRGYVLGIGLISSKKVGINHKEYGVTSRGVVKCASIAMREIGIDIQRDPFSVRFTGGPNGDVAGNSMALLLKHCPEMKILSIVDGTAGLWDPEGISREELRRLVLKEDLDHFDPEHLGPGAFIVFREKRKAEGLRELYRRVVRVDSGLQEDWLATDDFFKEIEQLIFSVSTDLLIPCGGRPETVDARNWPRFFRADGTCSAKVIIEGANSFISPLAREEIQKRGVVLLRDATANKCGVISSSYEVIANLLMTEKEFLKHKEAYVKDVLAILEKRAEEEANLIFKRHRQDEGKPLFTEISSSISREINDHYAKFFDFFQKRSGLVDEPLFHKVILNHLPAFIRNNSKYKGRVANLPQKIKCAILASEIASFIVYHGGWETDLDGRLREYLKPYFC